MSDLPQLYMRRDLDDLPPLNLPEGMSFHTHDEQSAAVWEPMILESFGFPMSYEKVILQGDGFRLDGTFYPAGGDQQLPFAPIGGSGTKERGRSVPFQRPALRRVAGGPASVVTDRGHVPVFGRYARLRRRLWRTALRISLLQ